MLDLPPLGGHSSRVPSATGMVITMADEENKPTRVLRRGQSEEGGEGPRIRIVPRLNARAVEFGERKPRWVIDILQVVALVAAVALLIHALALLMRAGFDDFQLFEPHVEVGGLHGTRLMAIIEGVTGLLVLWATIGLVDQTALRVLGFVAAIVGAVVLIEPDSIHEWVGVHEENGLVALGIGASLLLASTTPVLAIYPRPAPKLPPPWERSSRP